MLDNKIPTVFISYSLDDEIHEKWIRDFATRLRSDGLDAKLDKWELKPGNSVTRFLETAVRDNDFVLLICTPLYKEKFDLRMGGVEYEAELITGEALFKKNRGKFIPVLRKGTQGESVPTWMMSSSHIDLSDDPYVEKNYTLLLAHMHGEYELPPPLGSKPKFSNIDFNLTEIKETRTNWVSVGRLVTIKDVISEENTEKYNDVLTGQVPKFEHLRKGCFRQRTQVSQSLLDKFKSWILKLGDSDFERVEKIPVFWIGGRSGEGKSVLLLQLIAEIVQSNIISPIIQLKSGEDLPELLEHVITSNILSEFNSNRIFVLIDDMYNLMNRDEWDERIRKSTSLWTPSVAIITCGPTEQLEQAQSRLSDQLEVFMFEIPHLTFDEIKSFADWYSSRTGLERDLNSLTTENPLLVQLMFELAQGLRLSAFAKRFKKRLSALNLFDAVRTILSINALYLDAPLAILESDDARDALERLCEEDQLHFRITSQGDFRNAPTVRLAHSHLAWLLFVEWVEPPVTLPKLWARELSKVMSVLEKVYSSWYAIHTLLHRLLTTDHLTNDIESNSLLPRASREEFLSELYRLDLKQHQNYPSIQILPRWLEFEYKFPNIQFNPDPVEYALTKIWDESVVSSVLHPSIATWIWLISESQLNDDRKRLQNSVIQFLITNHNSAGAGSAIVRILSLSQDKKQALSFAHLWLASFPSNPQASHLIAKLLSDYHNNADIKKIARAWYLDNKKNPSSSAVITGLLSSSPEDEIVIVALDWLSSNRMHPTAPNVVASIVAANPNNKKVWEVAKSWLAANDGHIHNYDLLRVMIRYGDEDILKSAGEWIRLNETHPGYHEVLRAMIVRKDGEESWLHLGEEYLKKPFCRQPVQIIVALLTSSHCAPIYIDMALDLVHAAISNEQRVYVLSNIARLALANSNNVLAYLNGDYQHRSKRYLCRTLAWGLKRYRQKISEFLSDANDQIPSNYSAYIICELIGQQVESGDLDQHLIQWLNSNCRRSGYGAVIKTLRENTSYWKRIQAAGSLKSRVVEDFESH